MKRRRLPGDVCQLKESFMEIFFFGAGIVHKDNKVIIMAIERVLFFDSCY